MFFSNIVLCTCTMCLCMHKVNSLENITWSKLGKQNIQGKKVYCLVYLSVLHVLLISPFFVIAVVEICWWTLDRHQTAGSTLFSKNVWNRWEIGLKLTARPYTEPNPGTRRMTPQLLIYGKQLYGRDSIPLCLFIRRSLKELCHEIYQNLNSGTCFLIERNIEIHRSRHWKTFTSIQGNWAGRNFITVWRVNSRLITHATMQGWIWNGFNFRIMMQFKRLRSPQVCKFTPL